MSSSTGSRVEGLRSWPDYGGHHPGQMFSQGDAREARTARWSSARMSLTGLWAKMESTHSCAAFGGGVEELCRGGMKLRTRWLRVSADARFTDAVKDLDELEPSARTSTREIRARRRSARPSPLSIERRSRDRREEGQVRSRGSRDRGPDARSEPDCMTATMSVPPGERHGGESRRGASGRGGAVGRW